MRIALALLIGMVALHASAASSPAAPWAVTASVPPALAFLEQKTVAWLADHGCASCHHAPMMLWASEMAKAKGFSVDEVTRSNVRTYLLDESNAAKVFPPDDAPPERDGSQIASIYVLLALEAGPTGWEHAAVVARTRSHYARMQQADGSWPPFPSSGRPPILEGHGASARLLVAALASLPPDAQTAESQSMVENAQAWLKASKEAPSHQVAVFQFLAEMATGMSQEALNDSVASLLAQQRPDGSWGQVPELPGDALATGQSLYALGTAGIRADNPAVMRAVAFLHGNQLVDGSWPMVSRPVVGGPMTGSMEGGKNLEPIIAMATGWALVGMLSTF